MMIHKFINDDTSDGRYMYIYTVHVYLTDDMYINDYMNVENDDK